MTRPDRGTAEAGGAHQVGALALVVAGEDLKRAGDVEGVHASNKTISTARTRPSLPGGACGSNDENPAF
jgi:hypothetical protein